MHFFRGIVYILNTNNSLPDCVLAGVSKRTGKKQDRKAQIHYVQPVGKSNLRPVYPIPHHHTAHVFKKICRRQETCDRLSPSGKRGYGIKNTGKRLDERSNCPNKHFHCMAVAQETRLHQDTQCPPEYGNTDS